MPERFARADLIIVLEIGRWTSAWRYIRRCVRRDMGIEPRYGVASGVTDRFNWRMLKWILWPQRADAKALEKKALSDALLVQYADKIICLRSFDDVDWYVSSVSV